MQRLRAGAQRPKGDTVDITLKEQEQELMKSAESLKRMMSSIQTQKCDLESLSEKIEVELQLVADGQLVDSFCDPSYSFNGAEETDAIQTRGNPAQTLETAGSILNKAVASRKLYKRQVITMEQGSKPMADKATRALRHSIKITERAIATTNSRTQTLEEEYARAQSQANLLKNGIDERCRERDIVSKRLRLRQQRPLLNEDHDKVCAALEKEYDVLDAAVDTYNRKHNHLSVELSRLQDTIAHASTDLASLKKLLAIDRHLLTQPLTPLPQDVITPICAGSSSVYGSYGEVD
eukprot:TRINITY_DN9701_c0_g1_i3.p2 TRINITY_DN9701_c0_g1~~TRINITY_DN9701_c0_g1_i3.p2  ORF type:complete len:293 (+),score=42.22 TRINITY_DN9701_c0_g1_i3:1241-2119(+)